MATTQNLLIDTFRARQKEAIRHGKIDVNRVRSEQLQAIRSSDRDFLLICASIEKTAEAMVDDWASRIEDAAHQTYNRLAIRKIAHDLIESYITDAKSWKRIPQAFPVHNTYNIWMDDELDRVHERLNDRFDDRQNRVALKPKKQWHELNPKTWAIVLGATLAIIAAILAFANFAAQTVTKPVLEGERAASTKASGVGPSSS